MRDDDFLATLKVDKTGVTTIGRPELRRLLEIAGVQDSVLYRSIDPRDGGTTMLTSSALQRLIDCALDQLHSRSA